LVLTFAGFSQHFAPPRTKSVRLQKGQVVMQGRADDVAVNPALATYLGV